MLWLVSCHENITVENGKVMKVDTYIVEADQWAMKHNGYSIEPFTVKEK